MHFPSLVEAGRKAKAAAARFPLVVATGALATLGASLAVAGNDDPWVRFTLAALLGVPLTLSVALWAERRALSRRSAWLYGGVALLLPLVFFVLSDSWSKTLLVTRFVHLEIGLHLMVAVVPFLWRPASIGFWQYNRTLFIRFLTGALFTAVLFAGLALALAALDKLFGVDIDSDLYLHLFWLLAFLFSPWYFVAGVPADMEALDRREDYPLGLKVFAQFILIPLVTVYLLILTSYLGRVLITRTWPSGWIGWLVSGVAVTGTLALLLVHPLRDREDSRWVDTYGRWFFVALLPSVAMLLTAIGQRVGQYGFTERRYFLLVLAVVLAGIAIWYAVTASRNIRIIPATLMAAAFVTLVGPWSAYSVSRRSQLGRIETVLARNGLLVEGRAVPATSELSLEDRREVSGALRYMLAMHGIESVTALLTGPTTVDRAPLQQHEADQRASEILESLGIDYVGRWAMTQEEYFYLYPAPDAEALPVTGYDWLLEGDLAHPFVIPAGTDTLRFRPLPGILAFSLTHNAEELIHADFSLPVADAIAKYRDTSDPRGLARDMITFESENERAAVLVRIMQLNGRRLRGVDSVQTAQARVLVRLKD
jgi:hypothetical protein